MNYRQKNEVETLVSTQVDLSRLIIFYIVKIGVPGGHIRNSLCDWWFLYTQKCDS